MERTGRGVAHRVLVGKQKGKYQLEHLGVEERIVLKSVFIGQCGGCELD